MSLKDKVVLVTGASRGVGAALSLEAANRGAKVVCAARGTKSKPSEKGGSIDGTVEMVTAAGGEAIAVAADMGEEEDILKMIQTTVDHFGRIDVLVNNAAAVGVPSDFFSDMGSMDWELRVNLRGPFTAMREAAKHIRANSATMGILWDDVYVGIKIEVPTDKITSQSIEAVMAGPSGNDYFQAASYYLAAGKDLKQALEWMKKATAGDNPPFWQLRTMSLIQAEMGDKTAAIATAKKSLSAAEKAGNADYIKMNQESISKWQQ